MNNPIPYEPKRYNRWVVKLPEELGIDPWMVKSTTRPKLRARSEHVNGGYDFPPMWIKFLDPIGHSTTQILWDMYLGLSNNLKDGVVDEYRLQQIRTQFENIRNNGIDFTIEMLDPTGVVIERWRIEKAKVFDFDFGGELNYSNDEMVECGFSVKPSNVILIF
jgi:hypothetical protein